MLTTTSMTAVSVSMRSAQDTSSSPDVTQRSTGTRSVSPPMPTCHKAIQDRTAAAPTNDVVMISQGRAPSTRPSRPAMSAPMAGRKTMAL